MNDATAIEGLLRRLEKVSRRLAKRFADELAKRASEATPAQIAGWQAMIWRYHAEVGMASIATPANLVKAAAVLDEFAAGFPEDQRFRLHFTFMIDPPDPAMGPATLAFLSWHYQGRYADHYGRLDRDPEGFEQARKLFAQPHPAAFFEKLAAEIG
jgi:hypothetical protein